MKQEPQFSHLDEKGDARMVDIGGKPATARSARATASVHMAAETIRLLKSQELPKGDVLSVAHVAGIMAAKETHRLIPMCHPLNIEHVEISFAIDEPAGAVRVAAAVRLTGKTGVEMEALTAASVAALTIYDMCKAVDRDMVISEIRVTEKRGGQSDWHR